MNDSKSVTAASMQWTIIGKEGSPVKSSKDLQIPALPGANDKGIAL